MQASESNVLNPATSVKVSGDQLVQVRELTWKNYLRAIKELTASMLKLVSADGKKITLDNQSILELIGSQETLVTWVVMESTGRDQAWVDSLSGRDMLALLKAVVDLNLTEEVVGTGKDLAGQVGSVLGLRSLSLAPSTRSSAPATPPPGSTR